MKVGVLLFVLRGLINKLEQMGLLLPGGDFAQPTVQQDLELAAYVESELKAHGVDIPDQVDKVIKALPLVFSLVK